MENEYRTHQRHFHVHYDKEIQRWLVILSGEEMNELLEICSSQEEVNNFINEWKKENLQ